MSRLIYAIGGRAHPMKSQTVDFALAHVRDKRKGIFSAGGCIIQRHKTKGPARDRDRYVRAPCAVLWGYLVGPP